MSRFWGNEFLIFTLLFFLPLFLGAKEGEVLASDTTPLIQPAPKEKAEQKDIVGVEESAFLSGVELKSFVDKTIITVGDLINYEMIIKVPKGYEAMFPPPGAELGEFMIRSYEPLKAEEKEGSVIFRGSFQITAYTTGDLSIPSFPVIITRDKKPVRVILREGIKVRVLSVSKPEDLEIRGVKEPQEIPIPLSYYLIILGVVFGVILIGLGTYLYFRLKRKPKPEVLVSLKPADELAFEELSKLEYEGLIEQGKVDEYYTRLSFILRKYLGLRFLIYALEYTTTEILEKLKREPLEHKDFALIKQFLLETDLVKFAKKVPGFEAQREMLSRAREIIENTREKQREPGKGVYLEPGGDRFSRVSEAGGSG